MTDSTVRVPDPGPMDADVAVIWRANAPAWSTRGLLTAETAERFAALCLGIAMDTRLAERLAQARGRQERRALQLLRDALQRATRASGWALGVIPLAGVETVPRGPRGEDAEMQEWIVAPAEEGEHP